jgi:uncharacterized protein YbcI
MASTETTPAGSKSAAISNMVVRVTNQYTGRGPTRARTYINDDLVSVVLRDSLTKGERTLAGHGDRELVLSTRRAFQDAMEADLVAGIHEILGRDVAAFLSANRTDPDYAVETFILAPAAEREGADIGRAMAVVSPLSTG